MILPTRMTTASGQWCLISGNHLVLTFSNDDGLTTLKQIRNTSVYQSTTNSLHQSCGRLSWLNCQLSSER